MSLEKIVADLLERLERRFYGKYRGFVVANDDPKKLGRLKVRVPSLLGENVVTGWALPCVPYGGAANAEGKGHGFLVIPEIGAGVWVEFEEGDLEFPIWTGTFWSEPGGTSELPRPNDAEGKEQAGPQNPPTCKIIKTKAGHTIQLEDAENNERILVKDIIRLDSDGITLSVEEGQRLLIEKEKIKIGSDSESETLVLGNTFKTNMTNLRNKFMMHQHTATSMGGPTTPPVAPFWTGEHIVPLSKKHFLDK